KPHEEQNPNRTLRAKLRPYQLAGPRQLRRPPKKLRIRRSCPLKASRSRPPGLRPISRSTAPAGGRGRELQFFHRSQELKRSKEPVPAKPQPIVVKNDFSRQTKWEAALPPAPAPLSIASAPNDQALTSIVAAPVHVPNPVKETLKVSQGVSQGLLVKRVQPVYPPQARQMHLEGTVQLLASIRKDGSISGVKQVSGDAILGRAAIDD